MLVAHDYDNDPGKPVCAWNDRADIDRVVTELVTDAHTILAALDGVELDDAQAEAVGLLALVAGQDVEPGDSDGTWRIAPVTRPDRMVSVHDPESRHVHKTNHNYRDGFKAHVGVEPDTGLITACELTAGNVGDAQAAPGLLADEAAPVEVLADSAYGSGEFRTPPRRPRSHGDDQTDPAAHRDRRRVHHRRLHDRSRRDDRHLPERDHRDDQLPHPARPASPDAATAARCVNAAPAPDTARSSPSTNTTTLLAAARAHARTPEFTEPYRQHRPMVERSIAWLVRRGGRKVRYRGIARNRIGLAHRCAAINLRRLINLGLHWDNQLALATLTSGPGADKEGTTPTAISPTSAADSHPQHRLFGRSCPGPTNNATTTTNPRERAHLLSGLLTRLTAGCTW